MKRKRHPELPEAVPSDHGSDRALKKQDRYGRAPWKPGEIPTRSGSLIPITERADQRAQPCGEFMAVQLPANYGDGYKSGIVDLEAKETDRKQTSKQHGVKVL